MAKKEQVPAIRFQGFSDPWEQRKLSEVFSSYTDPVDIPHDGYERLGIRSHAKGTFHSYVPAGHELQTAQMHRVAANKFIVNITFGWEHAVAVTDENDAGKLVSHRFPQFSLSDELDPQFLKFIILDERFRHHLWLASPGGAGRNRVLNLNQMLQYEIQIPCVAEQRKIAGALINIDTLITLHQRKYDKLVAIKRSMLEKMFPREGSRFPEIRFAGFTDPWEQRKLGDFTGKVTEKNTGMSVTETFTNSAEFGVISQLDFFDHAVSKDESISGYTIVCPEDFVYNPRISVTAPVGPINRNRLNRAGVMSPLYTVFRTDGSIDRVYLEHFFKTSGWHSYMQLNGNSGARSDRFSIGDDTFFAMPIPAPSLEEQRQLAGFLESLDTLITLHQRKLEKLQAIKRSMLEKMFV